MADDAVLADRTRWVGIKRSGTAWVVTCAAVVFVPIGATLYVVFRGRHDSGSPVVAWVLGGALGVIFGLLLLCDRAAYVYRVRGSTLRVRGRGSGVVDLARVREATVERDTGRRLWPTDGVRLYLVDDSYGGLTVKIGDRWANRELRADGLEAIADQLDRSSAPESVRRTAEWLRDYAYRPGPEHWPDR